MPQHVQGAVSCSQADHITAAGKNVTLDVDILRIGQADIDQANRFFDSCPARPGDTVIARA